MLSRIQNRFLGTEHLSLQQNLNVPEKVRDVMYLGRAVGLEAAQTFAVAHPFAHIADNDARSDKVAGKAAKAAVRGAIAMNAARQAIAAEALALPEALRYMLSQTQRAVVVANLSLAFRAVATAHPEVKDALIAHVSLLTDRIPDALANDLNATGRVARAALNAANPRPPDRLLRPAKQAFKDSARGNLNFNATLQEAATVGPKSYPSSRSAGVALDALTVAAASIAQVNPAMESVTVCGIPFPCWKVSKEVPIHDHGDDSKHHAQYVGLNTGSTAFTWAGNALGLVQVTSAFALGVKGWPFVGLAGGLLLIPSAIELGKNGMARHHHEIRRHGHSSRGWHGAKSTSSIQAQKVRKE